MRVLFLKATNFLCILLKSLINSSAFLRHKSIPIKSNEQIFAGIISYVFSVFKSETPKDDVTIIHDHSFCLKNALNYDVLMFSKSKMSMKCYFYWNVEMIWDAMKWNYEMNTFQMTTDIFSSQTKVSWHRLTIFSETFPTFISIDYFLSQQITRKKMVQMSNWYP